MRERSKTPGLGEAVRQLGETGRRVVLVAEPDPDHQSRLARLLTVQGHRVIGTSSVEAATTLMREFGVDVVLVAEELTLPDPAGVVADLVALQPEARIVIITSPEGPTSGIRPARIPALEYLARPCADQGLASLLSA